MALTLKQKLDLGNFVMNEGKDSPLSNEALAKKAAEKLGFPVRGDVVRVFRINLGVTRGQRHAKGTKLEALLARIASLEKKVANLEQVARFQVAA